MSMQAARRYDDRVRFVLAVAPPQQSIFWIHPGMANVLAAFFPFQGKTKPYRAICSGRGWEELGLPNPSKGPH